MIVPRISSVELNENFTLRISFADGTSGVVDVSKELSGPIFEPLRDAEYFVSGRFDVVLNTVVWPNGADFAPEYLYRASLHSVRAA